MLLSDVTPLDTTTSQVSLPIVAIHPATPHKVGAGYFTKIQQQF